MRVRGKVFVVTGGANGMGRELVLGLLARGAHVAAVDIDAAALQETADLVKRGKDRLSTHVLDITDREAVLAFPDGVIARHGAVDGLINNAGIIQSFVRVDELDTISIEQVMNVNFYGTLLMTKAFLPHLLKRPIAHIANVSSMGGFLPVPGQTLYGASKAAVKLFTEGLHAELADTRVRVTVVFPGAIGTDIAERSGAAETLALQDARHLRLINPMAPSKAARIIIRGIEKDRYRVLVGSDAKLMDLIYRLSPRCASSLIRRLMRALLPGGASSSSR